jgi:hypothetical protein
MPHTRREFLRSAVGWGGLLLAGSWKPAASRDSAPWRAALRFLAARQSADGAWRSERYAAFRDGDALTPVLLWALPAGRGDETLARGQRWLETLTDAHARRDEPWSRLHYPLFTASYAAQVFAKSGDPRRAGVWAEVIERLRTGTALGWPANDPMCGAWGDASAPPRYDASVPDMLAPNISATARAVEALAATGRSAAAKTALPFIERCQNFCPLNTRREFDDGGFFFALNDPIRNKAGVAGQDAVGNMRFHSYGSATCDGILALRACGLTGDHPRLRAAAAWLRDHGTGFAPGGSWSPGRATARESLVFYHAQAHAAALASLRISARWVNRHSDELQADLLQRQCEDGSWEGAAPDSGEDEPLLATAFALRAVALLD